MEKNKAWNNGGVSKNDRTVTLITNVSLDFTEENGDIEKSASSNRWSIFSNWNV